MTVLSEPIVSTMGPIFMETLAVEPLFIVLVILSQVKFALLEYTAY